jgi:hypothetical protein
MRRKCRTARQKAEWAQRGEIWVTDIPRYEEAKGSRLQDVVSHEVTRKTCPWAKSAMRTASD